ncbi:hypothetical protein GIB67_022052 [Kingdonia uniflora]|uniref:Homeobox domain-containing protein n=1 Tax=Kingdonia uniflora TaxID=39325 RepID=A0A7J7MU70_9MAGN|nr:hypothetical protein GIB67_022052 [Kingdonia uniflora]
MASSNRHWPSMFKSKPCNTHPWQQHADINPSLISSCQQKPQYTPGSEERSPEPKPRWNPRPEQIRILESIFNAGMVNPPRDEIKKIRAQLQEYGHVGDANVFYWFQNRKSRSKHKQRNLQNAKLHNSQLSSVSTTPFAAPSSSSSSSSEKTSPKKTEKGLILNGVNVIDVSNSPTASVNQTYFQGPDYSSEPFFFPVPVQHNCGGNGVFSQGFCFSELSNVVQIPETVSEPCPGYLLSELLDHETSEKHEEEKMKLSQKLHYSILPPPRPRPPTPTTSITTHTIPTSIYTITTPSSTCPATMVQIQGVGETGAMVAPAAAARLTVFINDMAYEVIVGPVNVRQAFGDDVVLINSSGQPVPTNEWGVTLHSLQPGAFYYLVCFAP